MLTTMPVWAADGSLPAAAESRSRQGNAKGLLIEGRLVTTHDGTKQEQDWYAVTLAKVSTVGWVVFLVGNVWQWTDEYLDEHSRGGIIRGGSYFKPQGSNWYFPNKIELDTHGKLLDRKSVV